jgi:lipopolysaccharide transport protein LptA
MYNKKSLGTIIFFGFVSIGVLVLAVTTQRDSEKVFKKIKKPDEMSYFKNVHFFRNQSSKPNMELKATRLEILNDEKLTFYTPIGKLFSQGQKIDYRAESGIYYQSKLKLILSGEIELSDKSSNYKCNNLTYTGEESVLRAHGDVRSTYLDPKTLDRIKLTSKKMISYLSQNITKLDGNVEGIISRRRKYEGQVKFQANQVELNSLKSQVKMSENVKIHRNNYYLQAQHASIFLENFNKKLKYYELYDDVKLEEKVKLRSGKQQIRRAYAEKLEAHQRSGRIVLTGAPRVEQGDDIIRGYQITLRENVELVEVDDSQSSFSIKRNKNE